VSVSAEVITVVVVDDHPIVREGVIAALADSDGVAVVGEAGTAREAIDLGLRPRPTVVLIDVHMPGGSGLVAIKELARVHPASRCLVLSLDDEDDALFAAMKAGARGYLLKGAKGSEIERAIRAAAAGELVFGAGVAERVAALFAAPQRPRGADRFPQLTDRELVLLDLVAKGMDNAAIAARLHLAPKTVRNQVSGLLAKLDVPDRTAAANAARRAGLGRDDPIG
jgi:DNA-binding NarL/FixJ family response regulator